MNLLKRLFGFHQAATPKPPPQPCGGGDRLSRNEALWEVIFAFIGGLPAFEKPQVLKAAVELTAATVYTRDPTVWGGPPSDTEKSKLWARVSNTHSRLEDRLTLVQQSISSADIRFVLVTCVERVAGVCAVDFGQQNDKIGFARALASLTRAAAELGADMGLDEEETDAFVTSTMMESALPRIFAQHFRAAR